MCKLILLFVIAVFSVNAYKLEGASRLVGGTYRSDINYVISLQKKESLPTYERGHKCGGVLITRQNALTAASCVLEDGQLIDITNYRVFAGTVLTNENADSVRDIASITVHPEYNSQTSANDIAVITLQNAFPDVINPMPMPTGEPLPVSTCEISGFGGRNTSSTASAHLITLSSVFTIGREACVEEMGHMMTLELSMICAVSLGSECVGDEGNPLVCNSESGSQVLIGLLSNSKNCVQDPYSPEVYTLVYPFATWVNQVLYTETESSSSSSTTTTTTTPEPESSSSSTTTTTTTTPEPESSSSSSTTTTTTTPEPDSSLTFMFVVIQCFLI